MVVRLDQEQKQAVYQYLANLGLESYMEQVECVLESRAGGDFVLRLLRAFYREGIRRGGEIVEEACNNKLLEMTRG